jgi:hypothetical protein
MKKSLKTITASALLFMSLQGQSTSMDTEKEEITPGSPHSSVIHPESEDKLKDKEEESEEELNPFLDLPTDVHIYILSFLDVKSIISTIDVFTSGIKDPSNRLKEIKKYVSGISSNKYADTALIKKLEFINDENLQLSNQSSIFSFFIVKFSQPSNLFFRIEPFFSLLRLPFPEFNLTNYDTAYAHSSEFISFLKSQAQNRRLKRLDFSGARLIHWWDEKADMEAGYEKDCTIDALGKVSPSLEYLNLSHTNLPTSAIKALVHFSNLIYLDLSGNPPLSYKNYSPYKTLQPDLNEGNKTLTELARCHSPIEILNLSGIQCGFEGGAALGQFSSSLKTLIWRDITPAALEGLASREFRKLKVLDFSPHWSQPTRLPFKEGDAALARALGEGRFPNLFSLNFSQSQRVSNDFARNLPQGSILAGLTSLDLSRNTIGDQGAEGLVSCCWPALKSLSLSDTEIGDKGAIAFAQAPVEAFPVLEYWNLSENIIGDGGSLALSNAAVGAFPALESLNLGNNQIQYEGLKGILSTIGKTFLFSLKELHLYDRRFGRRTWIRLEVDALIERGIETLNGELLILEKRLLAKERGIAAFGEILEETNQINEWEEKKTYSHKEVPTDLGILIERTVKRFNGEEVVFERKVEEYDTRTMHGHGLMDALLTETVTTASGEKKQISLLIQRNLMLKKKGKRLSDIIRFAYPNLQNLEELTLS